MLTVMRSRRRSKLWRVLKWAGLSVCIILVFALLSSLLFSVTMYRSGWGAVLGFGCVTVQTTNAQLGNPQQGWSFANRRADQPLMRSWWVKILHPRPQQWAVIVPLWIPPLLIAIPTTILWYRDRRRPKGCCQGCGYDLTGNLSGICPECGVAV
jgi:hypothetical protein